MLIIDCELMNGNITGQVIFVNTAKRSQEITQSCPSTFIRIDMDFTDAISIIVTSPFILAVANCVSNSLETIIAV